MDETGEQPLDRAQQPEPERTPQTSDSIPGARGPSPIRTILGQIVIGIQFVAVLVGMLAVLYEFQFQRPKDRDLRDVELHATVATLATNQDVDITGYAVQKIIALMHKDGVDMTGISVPNVTFFMADFENVDWSDVYMNRVEFACTDRMYDLIDDYDDNGTGKLEPCANLKGATFSGSLMRRARFNYANLAGSNFNGAVLEEARVNDSILSNSDFAGTDMSGIQIDNSDFSGSDFGRSIKFDCRTLTDLECVDLARVDFSSVKMPRARFQGAEIDYVDFSGSDLSGARFDCDSYRDEEICSSIEGVCLQGTNLTRAKLEGVSISNTDFSTADISDARFEDVSISNTDFSTADISGVRFRNVRFENVVYSDAQIETRRFDRNSLDSLRRGRVTALKLEANETPCTQPWRRELTQWKEKFALGR